MNYEKILREYIEHILTEEGITYAGPCWTFHGTLSPEELAELNRIALEVGRVHGR